MGRTRPPTATRAHDDEALKALEDRFEIAFYESPIPKAITTLAEGRYVDVNEAFERQMGYLRSEICGRTSLELDVWPTAAAREAVVATLLRHKKVSNLPEQFRTKSGRLITTTYSAGLVTLNGEPCILAAILDVTGQKEAEAALRESESKFRMLAETTQAGIFIYRQNGGFCYFNPQLERFIGFSAAELLGMSIWNLIHPDALALVKQRIESRMRGEPISDRLQFKVLTKNGETRWLDVAAQLIEYEGQPAILGTGFDITESKESERKASEYTALLQTLITNSPYGILMGGKDHMIRFCNSAFERIFQYREHEVIGRDPDELIGLPENNDARDISARVLRGEVVQASAVRRRKDGSRVDVEFHAVPLMSDGEFSGCFGIYQDISDRIRSEARLRALRDRLTRVQDDERAHIARELHDDIGQRLALLAIQLGQLQKTAHEASPSIGQQLETSRRLAEEICADAQRISHRLHPTQLVLLGLSTALSRLCTAFARQTGIAVDFVHDETPKLSPELSTCLYRIAQEAIQNAAKHSGSREIRVALCSSDGAVRLSIVDTGGGFDAAAADAVPGLGLISMTERARSVGGELTIESAIGVGTRVAAWIPLPRVLIQA